MKLVDKSISNQELTEMSKKMYDPLVKAVVDIEKGTMIVDAEMHADEERMFLEEHGSEQNNLWGINLHPGQFGTEQFVEFDSMINIRPSWGNRTRGVDDPKVREKIRSIVKKLVTQ